MGKYSEKRLEKLREINSKIKNDPQRPRYHFLPLAFWMNDPNGPIYYEEEYHIFYQFNPIDDIWGNIHWGHAKSKDLIYWEHLPIAIEPSKERNETQCFSGDCIINEGKPIIIYTSIGPDKLPKTGAEQWMAFGDKNMMNWEKSEDNPIMTIDIHEDLNVEDWRDPFLWKENGIWYAILGGHLVNPTRPTVLLYRSEDLYHWEFLNPLIIESRKLGKNWECPNFIQLQDKHILLVSPHKRVIYTIGSFHNNEFKPNKWKIFDYGKSFYATNFLTDRKNERKIIFGWIKGGGDIPGWNGCLSLPRVISLDNNGELCINPLPNLKNLRHKHFQKKNKMITDYYKIFPEVKCGFAFEINISLKNLSSDKFGISLDTQKRLEKKYSIGFDNNEKKFWVGKEKAKLNPFENTDCLNLHIFVDHSVFEIYINNKYCISSKIFCKDKKGFSPMLFVETGKIEIKKMDVWTLKSIW